MTRLNGFIDIKNETFGRLTVLEKATSSKTNEARWLCVCQCGNRKIFKSSKLRNGESKSCGCFQKETVRNRSVTHGMSKTRNYKIWLNMKNRCINKNNPRYPDYGGRGITVCERWLLSFDNFIDDMGIPPSNKHSIERKNNSLGYSKENCIWADDAIQARNHRRNVNLTYNGITKCLTDWASELSISVQTLHSRIFKLGWNVERALSTPTKF